VSDESDQAESPHTSTPRGGEGKDGQRRRRDGAGRQPSFAELQAELGLTSDSRTLSRDPPDDERGRVSKYWRE
jgi:hypothetical protein